MHSVLIFSSKPSFIDRGITRLPLYVQCVYVCMCVHVAICVCMRVGVCVCVYREGEKNNFES